MTGIDPVADIRFRSDDWQMRSPRATLLMLALASATAGMAQIPADPTNTARAFLEAFASSPPTAKKFVTNDAVMVVGHIGGPLADFIGNDRTKEIFEGCRLGPLTQKPMPKKHETRVEPWLRGGKLSGAEGSYMCNRSNGSDSRLSVLVILKDERVAMLVLTPVD
jgi:hypothetical protein